MIIMSQTIRANIKEQEINVGRVYSRPSTADTPRRNRRPTICAWTSSESTF